MCHAQVGQIAAAAAERKPASVDERGDQQRQADEAAQRCRNIALALLAARAASRDEAAASRRRRSRWQQRGGRRVARFVGGRVAAGE